MSFLCLLHVFCGTAVDFELVRQAWRRLQEAFSKDERLHADDARGLLSLHGGAQMLNKFSIEFIQQTSL